ncbi:MAG: hypothetical protein NVSMB62_27670 [Acidobacteriaceae bacterium]
MDLCEVIVDAGESAKSLDRPGLQRALGMLKRGEAAALLVVKLDRLTRSVVDLGRLVEQYFAPGRAALLSVSEQIDTRSAAGRLVLNVLASVSQWEREAIGERTAVAMQHKVAQGEYTGGQTPYGRARRQAAGFLQAEFEVSERRACSVVELPRATCRYESLKVEDPKLREDLRQLAAERPRFGYRRLHLMMKRKGWTINHKLIYRIYRQEGLTVRRRIRKRIAGARRQPPDLPTRPDQRWSMDCVSDALADGRVFRTLNLVDDFT